jgi:hypothetical protein
MFINEDKVKSCFQCWGLIFLCFDWKYHKLLIFYEYENNDSRPCVVLSKYWKQCKKQVKYWLEVLGFDKL